MLDIRRIRTDPDGVRARLSRRGIDVAPLDEVLALDLRSRELASERDAVRNRIRGLSRDVGTRRKAGDVAGAEALQAESKQLGDDERELASAADSVADQIRQILLRIPNLPSDDAPDGRSEHDNVVLRTHGPGPETFAEHQRVPHWEIGQQLGILDGERAAKISGSMFTMYRGWGARLLRAMVAFSLDHNGDAYEEIRPPTLVKTDTMISTGHLPKFEEDAYHVERDDLWAIPTAEVPLTSLGRDEVFPEALLPMRFMAYTSCFRREAGSAGRDTRGLLRSHEFDKVELLAYAAGTEQAIGVQEDVLARSEAILQALGLSYRVLDLCSGDLGASAARTWDIEAYAPGCGLWLEVSSVSWFGDYQARRANIRYRPAEGSGTEVCHTVNGSAMGWPRTVAAFLETHRRPDGSIAIPDALRGHLGGASEIPAR